MNVLRFTVGCLVGAALMAPVAYGDEIEVVDLATGVKSRIRAHTITAESWSEVKYRERPKGGREKSVPTRTVVDIVRTDRSVGAQNFESALGDLERGKYADAATAFQNICGGGYRDDAATGQRVYKSFVTQDPNNKRKRPHWTSEYAHYYYIKALLELAKARKDANLYQEVMMALVDTKYDHTDEEGKVEKRNSGGFLDRFKGGASRLYPHALLAQAEAYVGLGEFEKAQKVYDDLIAAATTVPLRPRWHYEGLIGKGVIAQAQANARDAERAFEGASATMLRRLEKETMPVLMEDYGLLFSQARTRVAEARLNDAERRKAPSAFKELRTYIQAGSPESLRARHGAKLKGKALAALVSGARHPAAQAVALNGTGLAYMAEKKYEEALLAFKSVAVKYYGDPEQTSRAYFYVAKAAEAAAKKAKGDEAKAMYTQIKEEARRVLRSQFRDTRWGKK